MIATDDEIVNFIIETTDNKNYPPTIREIMDQFGYESSSTVKARLDRLKKIGRLTSEPGKPRTLKIIK